MTSIKYKKIKSIDKLISVAINEYEIIAPFEKEGGFVFKIIEPGDRICLDYDMTVESAKRFFFPPEEEILKFENNKIKEKKPEIKKRIFLGAHPCDINALLKLDKVFKNEYLDPYYLERRKNTIIIGLACKVPGEHCFCYAVDLKNDGYDIMLIKESKGYLAIVKTEKGKKFVDKYSSFFEEAKLRKTPQIVPPKEKFKVKINLKNVDKLLRKKWDSKVWDEVAEACLSCGSCNLVCPTCHCYTIEDDIDIKLKKVVRQRLWDSCQLRDFALVASGENFRSEKGTRLRNRISHKFRYFPEKYGEIMCVGCGRCIISCPAEIDETEVIKKLQKERRKK
jgi:ferredoxin